MDSKPGIRPSAYPPVPPEEPGETPSGTGTHRAHYAKGTLEQLDEELGPDLEVLRHIGDESFGSLFLAREPALRREVVIKVLRREYIDNQEARLRFERDARAAARISHPNVVPVFRVGKIASGVPFFVQPYLGECTLSDRLKSVGRFQPSEVRPILLQLAAALEAAHHTGIVHRDVRPETVRCEGPETERLLLTDFGIAGILETAGLDEDTITYPGEVLGSAGYMSPEQRDAQEVTDRSDVYSLGVLAWRLLAGASAKVPSVGEDMDRSVMLSVAPDDPDLIDLIARCLRESPGDRPSAASIVRQLEVAISRSAGGSAGTTWAHLRERRIPGIAGLMFAAMVTAMSVLGFVLDLATSSPDLFWGSITVLIAVFLGLLVVAWFHGKKGRQEVTRLEVLILGGLGVATLAICVVIWR